MARNDPNPDKRELSTIERGPTILRVSTTEPVDTRIGRHADGPAAVVLAATIAQRYYFDGASKSQIAAELGLNRFKVARVLDQARSSGLVHIELRRQGTIDLELSVGLAQTLGLRRCLVIECPDDDEPQLRSNLGRATAELLAEIVHGDDVLGLAWSRSLMAMRSALTDLPPCAVVQLTGAISRSDVDESSIELVRDVARIARGPAFCFYAPMIVPDSGTARALRTQPEVAAAMARFSTVTKAVVAVGRWGPGHSTVFDAVDEVDRRRETELGVHAELGGLQLSEDGRALVTPLSDRIVGVPADQLRAVPEIIAIAYGRAKASSVRAAVRGGFVTTLVTHSSLAAELLEHA